jgi:hypothetical protein
MRRKMTSSQMVSGLICVFENVFWNLYRLLLEDADETAEKVPAAAEGDEAEGENLPFFQPIRFFKLFLQLLAESPARGKKRKHEGGD